MDSLIDNIDSCHICYVMTDELYTCDKCDNLYCYDCSYTFTIHYQYEGSLCHWCSDQGRRKKLTREELRNNKIELIKKEV